MAVCTFFQGWYAKDNDYILKCNSHMTSTQSLKPPYYYTLYQAASLFAKGQQKSYKSSGGGTSGNFNLASLGKSISSTTFQLSLTTTEALRFFWI